MGLVEKVCSSCSKTKPIDLFSKTKSFKDGFAYSCKECDAKRARRWYEKNKESHIKKTRARQDSDPERDKLNKKKAHILRSYKIDWDTYLQMIAGGCEVCGEKENLHIDHDHACCPQERTCGKCVRGVLCGRHNRADGAFKNIDQIKAFLEYRMKHEGVVVGI